MRSVLMASGMASQERAYLAPPDFDPDWMPRAYCGAELHVDDAYFVNGEVFCDSGCFKKAREVAL